MFDVLSVRTLYNTGKVKAIIAGPYSAAEAEYQRERLQLQADKNCMYSVVPHFVCPACVDDTIEDHECRDYLRKLPG